MKETYVSSLDRIPEDENILQDIDRLLDSSSPSDYESWNNLGNRLVEIQSYSNAIFCYNKAIDLNSNFVDALYNKGLALSNLGKYDEAIICYDKVIKSGPINNSAALFFVDALYNKGLALSNLGKYDEAIRCYDKVIELDPKNVDALYNKGLALSNLGKYDEAIRCYDKVIELDPKNVNALNAKGLTQSNLGKYDEAIRCYDKVIELDPKNVDALNGKGTALETLGNDVEAAHYYDKVADLYAHKVEALNNEVINLLNDTKYHAAVKTCNQVLELDPNNESALYNKGLALSNLGKYDEAIRCYDKVIELDPKNVDALYNKGLALSNLGKYDEAIRCYDKVIELDPKNVNALNAKANALLNNGYYNEAEKYLIQAYELGYDQKSALTQLHLIYSRYTNELDKALGVSQKLLDLDPGSPERKMVFAQDLIKAGKYKNGRAYAQSALKETPESRVRRQLILRFLITLSYFLDGNLSSCDKEIAKLLAYYQQLDDNSFKIEESDLDFKGFKALIDNSSINLQIKSNLGDLINILRGTKDNNKILKNIASNLAYTNVKSQRIWKRKIFYIILPFSVAIVITSILFFKLGALENDKHTGLSCSPPPLNNTVGGFARKLQDVAVESLNPEHGKPVVPYAYVVNNGSDTTTRINTCTLEIKQILTGKATAVAVNPKTNTIYLANSDSDTVSFIEKNQTLAKKIIVKGTPSDIAVDEKHNTIFVAHNGGITMIDGNTNSNDTQKIIQLYQFDPATNKVTNKLVGMLADIDIDTNNDILYAITRDNQTIFAITKVRGDNNQSYYKEVGGINLKDLYISPSNALPDLQPSSISVDNITGKLYAVSGNVNRLFIIDASSTIKELAKNANSASNDAVIIHKDNIKQYKTIEVGQQPINVLANPKTHMIYVSNYDSDNVSVINDTTNKLKQTTIQVGQGPNNMAIDPKSGNVYVINEQDVLNPLVRLDASNIKNKMAINVGHNPIGIDVDSTRHIIYVADYSDNNITVIDGSTNQVLPNKTISLGNHHQKIGPIDLSFDNETKMLYVANFLNNTVSVIDTTKNNAVIQNIPVGKGPSNIAIDPKTHNVYVTNTLSDNVSVLNLNKAKTQIQLIKVGKGPTDLSFDNETKMLYVANFLNNTVSVIDTTKNNAVIQNIAVGDGPGHIAIDPNPKTHNVYVTNFRDNTISQLRLEKVYPSITEMTVNGPSNGQPCTSIGTHAINASGDSKPANAIDKNPNTSWSDSAVVAWVQIDLGAPKAICRIGISWGNINPEYDPNTVSVSNSSMPSSFKSMFGSNIGLSQKAFSPKVFSTEVKAKEASNVSEKAFTQPAFSPKVFSTEVKAKVASNVSPTNTSVPPTKSEQYVPKNNRTYILAQFVRVEINETKLIQLGGHGRHVEPDKPVAELASSKRPLSQLDQVLAWPSGVIFDPNTKMLYVGSERYDWVSQIDPRSNNIKPVPVGRAPIGFAIDSKNNMLYITNRDSNTISTLPLH